MKIAILSMQRIVNAGSVLQAYSLREMIQEITGTTPQFLDINTENVLPSIHSIPESLDYEIPADYPPGFLQRGKRWTISKLSSLNKQMIRDFMEKELRLNCNRKLDRYDHVVVGSDEVFNHRSGVNLQLHGNVPETDHIFTYAASCGSACVEDIHPEDIPAVKDALENYSAVSVRDSATEKYVSSLYSGTVCRHMDPVLMGNLCQRKHRPVRIKNYLLVYAYGQRIRTKEEIQPIMQFAKSRNLKVVAVGGSQFWCDLYIPASPFRLLDYFHYADYVITDTFHGTIFSVINRKKFGVIVRQTNQNKLKGLLSDLGLQKRHICQIDKLGDVLPADIDYDNVEKILDQERKRTRLYLAQQLRNDYVVDNTI